MHNRNKKECVFVRVCVRIFRYSNNNGATSERAKKFHFRRAPFESNLNRRRRVRNIIPLARPKRNANAATAAAAQATEVVK